MGCTACATGANATIKHGDVGEKAKVIAILTDSRATVIDLTGFTSVALNLRSRADASVATVAGDVEGDPALGVVSWEPIAADWLVIFPGTYDAEWVVTFPTSSITAPSAGYSTIQIDAPLA